MNTPSTATYVPALASDDSTWMMAGCCVALASLVPIALYQIDVIPHLPDPPCALFDSDRIAKSKAAHPLGVPDALLGLGSFGVTLGLVSSLRSMPALRRVLAAKLAFDAAVAAFNATRQIVSFRKLCSWCTVTALSAGVTAYAGRDLIQTSFADAKALLKEENSRG